MCFHYCLFSNLACTLFSVFFLYTVPVSLNCVMYVFFISGNTVIYWTHQSMRWSSMVHLLQFPRLHKLTETVVGQHSSFTLFVSYATIRWFYIFMLHLFITGFLMSYSMNKGYSPLNIWSFIVYVVWWFGNEERKPSCKCRLCDLMYQVEKNANFFQ